MNLGRKKTIKKKMRKEEGNRIRRMMKRERKERKRERERKKRTRLNEGLAESMNE